MLATFMNLTLISLSLINLGTAFMTFKKDKAHPEPKRRPSVTVIVRTWDDDHIVERFINRVLAQDYPKSKLQLIIADDASSDKTENICKKYEGRITYVRAEKHHEKKAVFLNKVIKEHAKGEILVNTDIDAVMKKNWIGRLVDHFDDDVHAVCGPVYSGNYSDNWLTKMKGVEDFWTYSGTMWGRYWTTGTAAMYGSNHAIRMDTLKKIGYYGTKTITEDAEITTKMWKEGYKISMCKEAFLLVEAVSDLKSFMRERKRWNGGTIDAMAKSESKGLSFPAALTGVNALIWIFSIISLLLSFLNPLFIISFVISAFAVMLTMISFKAKWRLMIWIVPFLVLWGPLNIISILLAAKDHFFGKGVKWVKVEGEHYHKGVKMRSPLRR